MRIMAASAESLMLRRLLRYGILTLLLIVSPVGAQSISSLTIVGAYEPGIVGTRPITTQFSWLTNTLLYGGKHTWTYGPGTDGGILFGVPQEYIYVPPDDRLSGISSWLLMFNKDTVLFSVNNGITIDDGNTINMANLRMLWGPDVMDYGSGAGTSTLVPLVQDIAALGPEESGWMTNPDGSYHLIYQAGAGTCGTACATTIHLYGKVLYKGDLAPFNAPDGQINVSDLMVLMRFAERLQVPAVRDVILGDMNGDSALDIRDVLLLRRQLGY